MITMTSAIHRKPKRTSDLSCHNERKLSILISVFDAYKTAGEVAKETLLDDTDAKVHRRNVQSAMDRYRHRYTHPYLIHETLKRAREGGNIAYKCTDKGRKMACELFYRKTHGLNLKWELCNGLRIYHVRCSRSGCSECKFNPTQYPDAQKMINLPPIRSPVMTLNDIFNSSVPKPAPREPRNINEYKSIRIIKHKWWCTEQDELMIGDFVETDNGKLVIVDKKQIPIKDITQRHYQEYYKSPEEFLRCEFKFLVSAESLFYYYSFAPQ